MWYNTLSFIVASTGVLTIPMPTCVAMHIHAQLRGKSMQANVNTNSQTTKPTLEQSPICVVEACDDNPNGLAANLVWTATHIMQCETNGYMPYVYWSRHNRKSYCAHNNSTSNCWSDYFRSIPVQSSRGWFCNEDDVSLLHKYHPQVIGDNLEIRHKLASVFHRHVQLQPSIQDEVARFQLAHFEGHKVIGVHVRGGDGAMEYGQLPLPVSSYFDEIDRLFEELGGKKAGVRIFVASNSPSSFAPFTQRYGAETVLSVTDALRIPPEHDGLNAEELRRKITSPDGYAWVECKSADCPLENARGVLLDVWLLSLCDHFVYWRTSVAWLALILNPGLVHHHVGPPVEAMDYKLLDNDAIDELPETLEYWSKGVREMNVEIEASARSIIKTKCESCAAAALLAHDFEHSPAS